MDSSPNTTHIDGGPVETPIPVIEPAPVESYSSGGSMGSVIAILLIVLLLVIGAFYVWGQRLSEQRAQQVVPAVGQ